MQINIIGARQRSSILRENVRRRKRLAVFALPALAETALSFLKNKRFLGNGSFCQRLRRICLFVRSFAARSLRFFFGRSFLIAVVFLDFSRLCFERKERFGFEMVFSFMAFFCAVFLVSSL